MLHSAPYDLGQHCLLRPIIVTFEKSWEKGAFRQFFRRMETSLIEQQHQHANICHPPQCGQFLRGRICSLWEQILPLKNSLHLCKVSNTKKITSCLQAVSLCIMGIKSFHVYPFTLTEDSDQPEHRPDWGFIVHQYIL